MVIGGRVGQEAEHGADVLIFRHAKHEMQPLARSKYVAQACRRQRQTARVVPHIANRERSVRHGLPAAAQPREAFHIAEALCHGLFRNALERQAAQGAEHRAGIEPLATSRERAAYCSVTARGISFHFFAEAVAGSLDSLVEVKNLVVLVRPKERCSLFLCNAAEHGSGFRCALADDYGRGGLDDAALLGGNLGERVAEQRGVLEADVGDDGEHGADDVGAVEPSAKPHFNHRHVYPGIGKVTQCHGGCDFKKRGTERLEETALLFHEVHHVLLAHRLAVHTDTLSEVHEVGRGVQSHA